MLAGPQDFISRAVRCRKALGGGMRQSGVIAAAGKLALQEMAGRLEEDHRNAKTFAQGESLTLVEGVNSVVAIQLNHLLFTSSVSSARPPPCPVRSGLGCCGNQHPAFPN